MYQICNIPCSTSQVQNLGLLVGDTHAEELIHQGLRVTITHDGLALIKVLQILGKDGDLCD